MVAAVADSLGHLLYIYTTTIARFSLNIKLVCASMVVVMSASPTPMCSSFRRLRGPTRASRSTFALAASRTLQVYRGGGDSVHVLEQLHSLEVQTLARDNAPLLLYLALP